MLLTGIWCLVASAWIVSGSPVDLGWQLSQRSGSDAPPSTEEPYPNPDPHRPVPGIMQSTNILGAPMSFIHYKHEVESFFIKYYRTVDENDIVQCSNQFFYPFPSLCYKPSEDALQYFKNEDRDRVLPMDLCQKGLPPWKRLLEHNYVNDLVDSDGEHWVLCNHLLQLWTSDAVHPQQKQDDYNNVLIAILIPVPPSTGDVVYLEGELEAE
jgi:hypothetical protein